MDATDTTLAPVPEWVRAFCAQPDTSRVEMADPHTVIWRGAPAVVATNGHKLVLVPGEFDAPPFAWIDPRPLIDAALRRPSRPVRVSALRSFCGVPPESAPLCETCRGSLRVECGECEGEGVDECECDCGHVHDADCGECSGQGDVPCPACGGTARESAVDPVLLGGQRFNRWLLAEVLRALPLPAGDTPAQWHEGEPTNTAALATDEWVVLVMPVRDDERAPATFTAWEAQP